MPYSSALVRLGLGHCVPLSAEDWRNVDCKLDRVQNGTDGIIEDL